MKGIILSGFRPTGRAHLGHLMGALENWVKLQDEYTCYFEVADWHSLTTGYDSTSEIQSNIIEMAADWFAAGIDPKKSTIFIQSQVKAHAELHLLFSMITPISWLERNPTLKEQVRDLNISENMNYGLLGYPVLQAADILCYKATAVPVGEDQLPHLELAREIARKFNSLYGDIFPEPKSLITKFARVPGIDGKKMSKSMNNSIYIADTEEETVKKVKTCITDTAKVYKNDPGHPDVCNVFQYHRIFNGNEETSIRKDCESGVLGCVDCKKRAAAKINEYVAPVRERRFELMKRPEDIRGILEDGSSAARKVADATLNEANKLMNLIK